MEKQIIQIDGQIYIISFHKKIPSLFKYNNGNIKRINEDSDIPTLLLEIIIEESKLENPKQLIAEINSNLAKVNIKEIYSIVKDLDINSREELKEAIKSIYNSIKTNAEIERKTLSAHLNTLFQENQITDYNYVADDAKQVLSFMDRGINKTVYQSDNENIFTTILESPILRADLLRVGSFIDEYTKPKAL